eukprot:gene27023-33241_t
MITSFHLARWQEFRRVVASLQRDCKSQLETEQEAKEAFSFLNSQVKSLRAAFATLSDLVVEEVDNMRSDLHKLREQQKLTLAELTEAARLQAESEERSKQMQRELLNLRSKIRRIALVAAAPSIREDMALIQNALEASQKGMKDLSRRCSRAEKDQVAGYEDLSRRCSLAEKDQ